MRVKKMVKSDYKYNLIVILTNSTKNVKNSNPLIITRKEKRKEGKNI